MQNTIHYDRREFPDPLTGRTWTQLTCGAEWCYPLYYFGHVATADGGTVLFYRYSDGEIQNWKLDIATGDAVQLTHASTPNCMRHFWLEEAPAQGVREHVSTFCPATEELTYFDRNVLHSVHVRSLADRIVYELPADRHPTSISGISPSGRHFAFAHVDRAWWEKSTAQGWPQRHEAVGCRLEVLDMQDGSCRPLVVMNAWLTHIDFYDEERIIFTNPPTEGGLMMTDLRGGWFVNLRTQTPEGVQVNHCLATQRGIMYETVSPLPNGIMGYCDPDTYESHDFLTDHPVHHTGHDWEGRLWFGDVYKPDAPYPRHLMWLPRVRKGVVNPFTVLTHGFQMHGFARGQRSHVHPTLLPDRQHLLFTGPDDRSKTNHLFLLDVSDLAEVETEVEGYGT